MTFSFKMFEPRKERAKKTNEPLVEVRTNGRIVFNKVACQMLNNSPYCMLGFDAENRTVGLLPIAERKINAFPIRYVSKGAYVGAKNFFRYFGILPSQHIQNSPISAGEYIGVKI